MKSKRIPPRTGQESVWDYPRPPLLERTSRSLRIEVEGNVLAATTQGYRVLETSHPPVYYFPPGDIDLTVLERHPGKASHCEFKGRAAYWNLVVDGEVRPDVAWSYPDPRPAFAAIRDYLAFYPSRVDACFVDEERVRAQEGDFYGGWITADIVGPFKGAAGTWGW
jgi:uncharacterized protein (DUF427 family)